MKKRNQFSRLVVGWMLMTTLMSSSVAVAETSSLGNLRFVEEADTTSSKFELPTLNNVLDKGAKQVARATSSEELAEVTVSFLTPTGSFFTDGSATINNQVETASQFQAVDFPTVVTTETQIFEGWKWNGELYTEAELAQQVIEDNVVLTAVLKETVSSRQSRGVNDSIAEIIATADTSQIIVVPSPIGNNPYKEYTPNDTNLKVALYELYHNQTGGNFTIYFGTTVSATAATVAKVMPAEVNATNATFYALKGKVDTLTLTGAATDPINGNTSLPANTSTLNLPTNNYFGTNLNIRNLNYTGSVIFMEGHDLTLNGGSFGNGFSIFGGSDGGEVIGSPRIEVNATGGTVGWSFYGGNQSGGELIGNPQIVINQTTGPVARIAGGAQVGTVTGNTSVAIHSAGGPIQELFGGGYGSNNTTARSSVSGNVSLTSAAPSGTALRFNVIYGGAHFGDIGGSVTTNISGYAGWTTASGNYYGGSRHGNIGSQATASAITTNLDTSKFSTGRAAYTGANSDQGTITGNITSTVKAGTVNAGGINDFNGGGGNGISKLSQNGITGGGTEAAYDARTPAERAAIAEASANFKVYGNISSYLVSGLFSYGANYSTAAGRGGYIEGNTSIKVGTLNADGSIGGEGIAYRVLPTNLAYSTTIKNRGEASGWDIVGGGGYPGIAWDTYIKGDTSTTINNAVARWIYGGSYSGVIEGNSSNTLNGGIVDTLEGTGYNGRRVFGNGSSTVNNGQVDWFLTGGSWDDAKVVGNVAVTVYDGTINASMGASYGVGGGHTITGNSNNVIYGGDFSGTPRTGNNVFSGGITNSGTLQGNANLTIDLRNYEGTFKLPTGTSISGGVPYNVGTSLGTNADNTITLNIYTKPGTDVLNGANIYGDAGLYMANTKSGQIRMNIDAPESSIGNLYATRYANISSNKIVRDVSVNVQRAASINGISGGAINDNFTNTIVENSDNQSKFTFGAQLDGSTAFQKTPIDVTGTGIVNFTSLRVQNQTTVRANGGSILNGRSATALNHGATYSGFGDITLTEGGGLGIKTAVNLISAGQLIIDGEVSLYSPPGTGKVNLRDVVYDDEQQDRLTWIKTTENDSNMQVDSIGTWFGSRKAYQVLTINPTAANAEKLTPFMFMGREETTGKTFIGDNDLTKGANGYGIAIPGSVIDYEVHQPIQDGQGDIMHDVKEVVAGNSQIPLKVWGTEVAGTKVQQGRLVIPSDENILPTLTFTPETEMTGSWLYGTSITSTKEGASPILISEQGDSNPVTWSSLDSEYSYAVKVQYSNKVELAAQNALLTESEASALTIGDDLAVYTKGRGRPFLEHDITSDRLADIQAPLAADQLSRATDVTYKAGTAANNQIEKTVKVTVVKDQTEIADSRQFGVYALDGIMNLAEANGLSNRAQLEADFTTPVVIFGDGTTGAADSDEQSFLSIKNTVEAELLKIVPIAYSYVLAEEQVIKEIDVKITGILELFEVPTRFNFGEQKITNREKTYWPTIEGDLVIKDTRGTEKKAWQLMLKEEVPLTNGSQHLADRMSFVGDSEQAITADNILIETHTLTENGSYNVTESWQSGTKGIKLQVPVKEQAAGEYSGTLSWSLVDGPANE